MSRYGLMAAAIATTSLRRQDLAHPADAADVRVAVLLAEAEALRQVGADLVAVEHLDLVAALGAARSTRTWAMVLLPEPERPVNQIVKPVVSRSWRVPAPPPR